MMLLRTSLFLVLLLTISCKKDKEKALENFPDSLPVVVFHAPLTGDTVLADEEFPVKVSVNSASPIDSIVLSLTDDQNNELYSELILSYKTEEVLEGTYEIGSIHKGKYWTYNAFASNSKGRKGFDSCRFYVK